MIIPSKLKKGDEVRVVAPSRSLGLLSKNIIDEATRKLEAEGFRVSFSKNCSESDMFVSSSVESRVSDLHDAFLDKDVKGIFSVIGGFNSNQLLQYLDYDLIKNNPKVFCGYSDFTAISNAITAKTGLVTYLGLHFSTWAMIKEFEYNLDYFKKCVMSDGGGYEVLSSRTWSDDAWYLDQENRDIMKNDDYWVINEGR